MTEHHPPANRYWHQGFGRREYQGGEVAVFQTLESMLVVLARSMLLGFVVEPVLVEFDDDEPLYGFREVPKRQLQGKKARSRISLRATARIK